MYHIKFKTSAAKEFREFSPQLKQRLQIAINTLKKNPRPAGSIKLKGSDDLYRFRVGDYGIAVFTEVSTVWNAGMLIYPGLHHTSLD